MTEYETIKTALERIGEKIKITEWDNIGDALIEVRDIAFWFTDGKLTDINNEKDY